jgi:hypothetical protein
VGDVLAIQGREAGPHAPVVWVDAAPRAPRTQEDGLPRVGLVVPAWSKDDVAEGDVLVALGSAVTTTTE